MEVDRDTSCSDCVYHRACLVDLGRLPMMYAAGICLVMLIVVVYACCAMASQDDDWWGNNE